MSKIHDKQLDKTNKSIMSIKKDNKETIAKHW